MSFNFEFRFWDVLLLVVVSAMSTAVAYLHHPKWKALILSLPIPFSVAILSLGGSINATHVLALFFLLLYTHGVRFLHINLRVPIVASVALSAIGYTLAATLLARSIPATETVFWAAAGAMFVLSAALHFVFTSHRDEPGHRTPLPVWIKLPVITSVVLMLVISKNMLQGFMTGFPMVGLLGAYEARRSLWTMCRAIPAFTLCLLPMMAMIHLTQPHLGQPAALALGWVVFLTLLIPITRRNWAAAENGSASDVAACRTGMGGEA